MFPRFYSVASAHWRFAAYHSGPWTTVLHRIKTTTKRPEIIHHEKLQSNLLNSGSRFNIEVSCSIISGRQLQTLDQVAVWTLTGALQQLEHLHCGLMCPKDIVPEVLRFVQMQLYQPKLCRHVLFREKRLSAATLPNKPYLFSLIVLSWTLTFNMLTEACRVWDVAHLLFAVSLSITQSDFGVNLLGRPLMGRLTAVNNLSLCWMMDSK